MIIQAEYNDEDIVILSRHLISYYTMIFSLVLFVFFFFFILVF